MMIFQLSFEENEIKHSNNKYIFVARSADILSVWLTVQKCGLNFSHQHNIT